MSSMTIFSILLIVLTIYYYQYRKRINKLKESIEPLVDFSNHYNEKIEMNLAFWNEGFPFSDKRDFLQKFETFKSVLNLRYASKVLTKEVIDNMTRDYKEVKESLAFWSRPSTWEMGENLFNEAVYFKTATLELANSYYDNNTHIKIKRGTNTLYQNIDKEFNNRMNLPDIEYFYRKYEHYYNNRDQINDDWIENRMIQYDDYLSNIDGKSLDSQQRNAVLRDENSTLVIAGAGSGKTLTISAKVAYLIDKNNVENDEILLLTFTKKAAQEMSERINKNLGIDVNATTFHAHGMSVIKDVSNAHPSIIDEESKIQILDDYLSGEISKKPERIANFLHFIALYVYLPYIINDDLKSIYDFSKTIDLKTLDGLSDKKISEYDSFKLEIIKVLHEIKDTYYRNDDLPTDIRVPMENILRVLDKNYHVGTDYEYDSKRLEVLVDKIDETIGAVNVLTNAVYMTEDLYSLIGRFETMTKDLRTLRSKVLRSSNTLLALNGSKVKSYQELLISNFFFIHGINYEYEKQYPFELFESDKKNYKPDFYLPDYDIYIEHFGINEHMRASYLSAGEERKYINGIELKRYTHKMNNTKLIETYSFEMEDPLFFDKFKNRLQRRGVIFDDQSYESVYRHIVESRYKPDSLNDFKKMINSYMSLFNGENYDVSQIDVMIENEQKSLNDIYAVRRLQFLKVFRDYYQYYSKAKVELHKIDFDDMISLSSSFINRGKSEKVNRLKYIIVDEYQDVSGSKVKYLKSIIEQSNAKIFAVGDDWQSIYGFSGSDVGYFTKFSESFGFTEICRIENTYRNSQELIDIAGSFVMANPSQLKKQLKSSKRYNNPVSDNGYSVLDRKTLKQYEVEIMKNFHGEVTLEQIGEIIGSKFISISNTEPTKISTSIALDIIRYAGFRTEITNILNEIASKGNNNVLLIGRTNYETNFISDGLLPGFTIKTSKDGIRVLSDNPKHARLKITYITAHKSKGLEADAVIVMGLENKTTGFPNKIVDDDIFKTIKRHDEDYQYAEERRLFYVALTRTRGKTYLMYNQSNPSIFLEEIFGDKKSDRNTVVCPRCNVGNLVLRSDGNRRFVGCNQYPSCSYTHSSLSILESIGRCKSCDGLLIRRLNPANKKDFYGCSNFGSLNCKTAYNIVIENGIEKVELSRLGDVISSTVLEKKDDPTDFEDSEIIHLSLSKSDSIRRVANLYIEKRWWFLLTSDFENSYKSKFEDDSDLQDREYFDKILHCVSKRSGDEWLFIEGIEAEYSEVESKEMYLTLVRIVECGVRWRNYPAKFISEISILGKHYNVRMQNIYKLPQPSENIIKSPKRPTNVWDI